MKELPKTYDPKNIEEKWYSFWEDNKFFHADPKSDRDPYCIVLPPPNVTGVLHMGHALVDTLQDILIRYHRMKGLETLWAPGTDHAGIATQTVVERHLRQKTGKHRSDFSREEFLKNVWEWKENNESKILDQLKKLGCSCDWDRLRFTMDAKSNRAVRTMFKKMYNEGLIYRGDYLVNWDPVAQTALADDEVEYEDAESSLWHFRYPFSNQKGHLVIATTRPETMLGDTAVAVHPDDYRYQKYIGEKIRLPFVDRDIPIISDHYVDPEFGTGVVKITPAHDPNDYEMSFRHNLPLINIMTPDGRVNENGKQFQGLTMKEARANIIEELKKRDLIEKIEPHTLRIGVSYRSKAVIEPYLSKQWFVKMTAFKQKLLDAIKEEKVQIFPKHWEQTYFHWIENLRDWCISRQIWWGHRIPIWYSKEGKMICHDGENIPSEIEKDPDNWTQDPDVLDTWFSSALWPFSILGWPDKTPELEKFYPTSVLVTGHDILFFWVARMILMGEYAMKDIPFHQSFIHGLIYGKSYWRVGSDGTIAYVTGEEKREYDLGKPPPPNVRSRWEKMSKSKGNIIDPLEIIDEYGTDAMRLALCSSVTQARQIDLDRRKFEEFKNFTNKVWNGARFVFMNLEGNEKQMTTTLTSEAFSKGINLKLLTLEDRWILSLLNRIIVSSRECLDGYVFDRAATMAYDFFWNEFCAYYLELAKPVLFGKSGNPELRENKQKILVIILCNVLRLMHPIAPFITEELFSTLKKRFSHLQKLADVDIYTRETIEALNAPACIKAPFPKIHSKSDINPAIEKNFSFMNEIIYAVRNIRAEMQIPPSEQTDLFILGSKDHPDLLCAHENRMLIPALVRTAEIQFLEKDAKLPQFGSSAIVGNLRLYIPLPEYLKDKEKSRLQKEREKLTKVCDATRQKLDNSSFKERAPREVVEKMEQTLHDAEQKLNDVLIKLENLSLER